MSYVRNNAFGFHLKDIFFIENNEKINLIINSKSSSKAILIKV